jgi:hypothetical protein
MSCEFRTQSARHAQRIAGDEARCPGCGRIDWARDGLVLVERDDGTLFADRVGPRRTKPDDWSCTVCGYDVVRWSTLSRLLSDLAVAARWSDVSVGVTSLGSS